jgi:hypothetical protein
MRIKFPISNSFHVKHIGCTLLLISLRFSAKARWFDHRILQIPWWYMQLIYFINT